MTGCLQSDKRFEVFLKMHSIHISQTPQRDTLGDDGCYDKVVAIFLLLFLGMWMSFVRKEIVFLNNQQKAFSPFAEAVAVAHAVTGIVRVDEHVAVDAVVVVVTWVVVAVVRITAFESAAVWSDCC